MAALDYYARLETRSRANTVQSILRRTLILFPNVLVRRGFALDQSIKGWIEANRRLADGEPLDFDPEDCMTFALAPLVEPEAQRRKCSVRFTLDDDEWEALQWHAQYVHSYCLGNVSKTVRAIVRTHLLNHPFGIEMPSFPSWQHLSLWVRANIERAKFGGPRLDPLERFGVSADGSSVLRFDYLMAQ